MVRVLTEIAAATTDMLSRLSARRSVRRVGSVARGPCSSTAPARAEEAAEEAAQKKKQMTSASRRVCETPVPRGSEVPCTALLVSGGKSMKTGMVLARAQLSEGSNGVPRVPSLESVIEFLIGMSTGDVEKGGSREARDKDCACDGLLSNAWVLARCSTDVSLGSSRVWEWYASPAWGKSQAEMLMPEDKKGKYGWGAYKDLPFRLGRIEQHVTARRQWLQEQLRRFEVTVANPMHDGWVDCAMQHLRHEIGHGRDEANLPPTLPDAVLSAMVAHTDVKSGEEVQTTSYVGTKRGARSACTQQHAARPARLDQAGERRERRAARRAPLCNGPQPTTVT